jgi:hypothetical protein
MQFASLRSHELINGLFTLVYWIWNKSVKQNLDLLGHRKLWKSHFITLLRKTTNKYSKNCKETISKSYALWDMGHSEE